MGRYKLSFQLYSARLFPPLEPVLEGLAEIGYDAVEPFLPNYGDDPKGFRKKIDAVGLACSGFHMPLTGLTQETDRFIDIAKTIGAPLMIPPWIPPEERDTKPDGWKRLGAALAAGAEKARAAGLKVAWHNHDFEFMKLSDGSRPIEQSLPRPGRMSGSRSTWDGWCEAAPIRRPNSSASPTGSSRFSRRNGATRHQEGRRVDRDGRRDHRLQGALAAFPEDKSRPNRRRARQSVGLAGFCPAVV